MHCLQDCLLHSRETQAGRLPSYRQGISGDIRCWTTLKELQEEIALRRPSPAQVSLSLSSDSKGFEVRPQGNNSMKGETEGGRKKT